MIDAQQERLGATTAFDGSIDINADRAQLQARRLLEERIRAETTANA